MTVTTCPVPGDPERVEWLSREYGRYAGGAADAARELRRIDTGSWVGPAGDAFRSAIEELPAKLDRGQQAFARASATLAEHARVLRDAQADAAAALRRDDPPAAAAAQERVAVSGRHAARVLDEARHGAPHEPGLFSKALHAAGSFLAGAGEATWGLLELGWKTSLAYAVVDPKGFLDNAEGMAKGIGYGVEHPKELGKALIDYDTWSHDPARALGHLVPDVLIAMATAGTGEAGVAGARAAHGAEVVEELAVAGERGAGAAARAAGLSEDAAAALEARFGSPTEGALEFQTRGAYKGQDRWWDRILKPGDTFSLGSPGRGQFAATPESVEEVAGDARRYNEGLQVQSRRDPVDGVNRYRSHLATYEVKKPLPVAESIAEANPRLGAGGLGQYFLPDLLDTLIAEGYISEPTLTEMTNLDAVIGPKGLPDPRVVALAEAAETGGGTLAASGLARAGGCR
jgi:uncharacterized protein YukE